MVWKSSGRFAKSSYRMAVRLFMKEQLKPSRYRQIHLLQRFHCYPTDLPNCSYTASLHPDFIRTSLSTVYCPAIINFHRKLHGNPTAIPPTMSISTSIFLSGMALWRYAISYWNGIRIFELPTKFVYTCQKRRKVCTFRLDRRFLMEQNADTAAW